MTHTQPHIAVIGAGMGGLASAIRLAAAGARITLIEAAPGPGGKMRTVPSAAGPVDAGPTVLTMRGHFDDLFAMADEHLDDHVTLHAEPVLARHWGPDGTMLDLFADREASVAAIADFAGRREAEAFQRFAHDAKRLFTAFDQPMMRAPVPKLASQAAAVLKDPGLVPAMAPLSTLAGKLARTFRDPRLRQLFGRYATYVGGHPGLSPAVLQLIWHAEASGVWRVEGGMHRLAEALADLAERLGVAFLYGTAVERLEIQQSRVSAVCAKGGQRIAVDGAVFNGDPRALRTGLLGPATSAAVTKSAVSPRSLSARVWSFAAEAQGPELIHHNVFFGHDPEREFGPITKGEAPEDPTLYICAEDRGHDATTPALERFEIIENAAPDDTEHEKERDICRTRVFDRLADFGLTFTPRPLPEAVTIPADFDRMFPASLGSLYGRSPHGMMASFQRPTARTTTPGLYLAGGGAHPGAGIAMAALSGLHAAGAIAEDLALSSRSRPMAMPGGISTASPMMAVKPSRSSPS